MLVDQGPAAADRELPEIARHLAAGCQDCATDLDDLIALAAEVDAAPHERSGSSALPGQVRPFTTTERAGQDSRAWGLTASRALASDDRSVESGLHVRDLPDPGQNEARHDAEVLRRRQLRTWRERLLIAAAVAIVAMGLSLIGIAYMARAPREAPRLDLAPISTPGAVPEHVPPIPPQPSGLPPAPAQTAPAQPAPVLPVQPAAPPPVPTQQPASTRPAPPQSAPATAPPKPAGSGVAAPNGMDCPPSYPIKGNRSSMIYHVPGGGSYGATRPEQCFAQPADAESAGYRRSLR